MLTEVDLRFGARGMVYTLALFGASSLDPLVRTRRNSESLNNYTTRMSTPG